MTEFDLFAQEMVDFFIVIFGPALAVICILIHVIYMSIVKVPKHRGYIFNCVIELIMAAVFIIVSFRGYGVLQDCYELRDQLQDMRATPMYQRTDPDEAVTPELDLEFWEELGKTPNSPAEGETGDVLVDPPGKQTEPDERSVASNERIFKSATRKWRVPTDILQAVYAKETLEGRYLGKYWAWQQLQDKPLQLNALKVIAIENGLDYKRIPGSSAGAVGYTQFMPLMWVHYGVDADKDGRRNPFDLDDAVHTTGRFLKEHHDQRGTWWGAIRAYNHSNAYTAGVLKKAEFFSKQPEKYLK